MANDEYNTNRAIETLLNNPYYWSLTGLPTNQRRQFANMLKNGKGISLDKKEQLLEKAGFTVKQEKIWNLPKGG